jgi:uncharacterized protein YijF (DUF1287 family)
MKEYKVGDLVTWRTDTRHREFGVIIEKFKDSKRKDTHWWVKFTNGIHAHQPRILCQERHLMLVKDLK